MIAEVVSGKAGHNRPGHQDLGPDREREKERR
jgi:hypothetical protein